MNNRIKRIGYVALLMGVSMTATAHAVPIVFSGSGATDAAAEFNAFRAAVGGGARITWDGVRLDGTDANPATSIIDAGKTVAIPVDRFRAAGAVYAAPYAVSGDGFASLNPATAGQFPAFTPSNTFAMFDATPGEFDDRFIAQSFVLPGTGTAAGTRGFGAIFADVELLGTSSIEYFGRNASGDRVSLGKFDVPVGPSGEHQFLGVVFDDPIIADVLLTVGTNALFSFDGSTIMSFGPESLSTGVDLAVTDDFVFAVPQQLHNVPVPSTLLLLAVPAFVLMRRHAAAAAVPLAKGFEVGRS